MGMQPVALIFLVVCIGISGVAGRLHGGPAPAVPQEYPDRGEQEVAAGVVATGFTWAENLRCDAETGSLFVSEYKRGELYKITSNEAGGFNQTVHVSTGYDLFAGLAIHEKTGILYAIAREQGGDCYIITVDKTVPQTTTKVAKLPKLGNGLAIQQSTGILYATAEGDFIPFEGATYKVDPATGDVTEVISDSYANDGAYINQEAGLLLVSEVIGSELLYFDTATQSILGKNRAPKSVGMLDDFCLSADGRTVFGADYERGNIVSFAEDGHTGGEATILLSKLKNPTSARWGCGGGFPTSSLFVTEGGSLLGNAPDRLVLQLFNVRA